MLPIAIYALATSLREILFNLYYETDMRHGSMQVNKPFCVSPSPRIGRPSGFQLTIAHPDHETEISKMKFMKLGSRSDTFYTSDAFPLLSKCLHLQRLLSESQESSQYQIVQLPDFPGGTEAFELCAKFCYGITITISPFNIVSARCAAKYLHMTEDVEKGNLVCKLEVFFNSCILNGWRDSIVTLKSTKSFPLWSEDLDITARCIEAIASKVVSRPSKANLSHSYSRREGDRHKPKGWWGEDIAELEIDLYWRTMIAIKSVDKMPSHLIGEALRIYASRWLPNVSQDLKMDMHELSNPDSEESMGEEKENSKPRLLLESIVSLLPVERGSVSCSFLLKLLKVANVLNASTSSKMELARSVGIQLEEATVADLLIPSLSYMDNIIYDVDIVMTMLEQFMLLGQSPPISPPRARRDYERRRSRSAENVVYGFEECNRRSSSASHSSKLKVAKLIDGYLLEIAREQNLPLSKFTELAEAVPRFSRLNHDDLYRAIDIYLKVHPNVKKSERKRICAILDCKKLSIDTCVHAARNERLPLRVVVQVLFFEQARAATAGGHVSDLPTNVKALLADGSMPPRSLSTNDQWSTVSGLKSPSSNLSTLRMKLADDDDLDDDYQERLENSSGVKTFCLLPNRPRRLFSKLWSIRGSRE
ncbi:hypothetical protein LguiB_024739 [Lonicera macranthoides]